eukprot:CAMPEP_0184016252 /NCGR_PEP_ID=MMETSP0954-20121128/6820_1 /TAXON_ID=627963 /ORGANISM="Aplanochytrium sp, Strain PBS07" /LENGTH=397 /DNA_ID=CAMNT_0026297241 /DNA_START=150 /DNA_END=1344 /DNA_ORIENTATION=+
MANFRSTDVRLLIRFTDHKIVVVSIGGKEHEKIEFPAAAAIQKDWRYVYFEEAIAARENNQVDYFEWIEHVFTVRRSKKFWTQDIIERVMMREDVMILGTRPRYVVVCTRYKRVGETSSLFSHPFAPYCSYTDHVLCESEERLYLSGSGLLNSVALNMNANFTNLVYNGSYNGHVAGPGFDDIVNYFIKLLCMKGYDLTDTEGQAFCRELVLKYCYVALDLESEMKKLKENGDVLHEIVSPSGIRIELGKECFLAPECLFDPDLVGLNHGGAVSSFYDILEPFAEEIEIDVLLCGYFMDGLRGFETRLQREITAMSNQNIELKFQTASSLEQGALTIYSKSDFPRNRDSAVGMLENNEDVDSALHPIHVGEMLEDQQEEITAADDVSILVLLLLEGN